MKKHSRILAIVLVAAMLLPGIVQAAPLVSKDVETTKAVRLGGETRTQTAILTSKEAYKDGGAETAVLVGYSGEVDALAGSLLASSKKAPVLISDKTKLSQEIKDEFKRLGTKNVYILGGEKAVASSIENELKTLGLKITRLAGSDRYDTAAKVAKEVKGKVANKIFLASGEEVRLADALAIAPVSAKDNIPVLLTVNSKSVPKVTMDLVKELGVKEIEIVGGQLAISDEVKKSFTGIKFDRVAGKDRWETAVEIGQKHFKRPDKAIVVYGLKYSDALVGGYLGAMKNAPILLSNIKDTSETSLRFLEENIKFAYVLGGLKVVSGDLFNKIAQLVGLDKDKLTITLLATTDVHGNIYNWSYEDGKETKDTGLAKVHTIVKEVRKENPNTILVDAGDLIQGTILTDEVYTKKIDKINPMIDSLNFMNYDAMVLGNHEFNFGLGVVERLTKDANFPVLAANIYNKKDGSNYAQAYTIIEKAGIKIGVLGLTNPNIARWDGSKVKDLEFKGMNEVASKYIKKLEGKNVDLIVAMGHAGVEQEYVEGDAMRLVIENNPQIDAAIVGHTHGSVSQTIGTTIIGGARDRGKEVIRIDIDLKKIDGKMQVIDKEVELIKTENYEASEELKEYTKVYHKTTLDFIKEEISIASEDFQPVNEVKGIPEGQLRDTPVIDLINQVQLEATGADISGSALFANDADINKGPITYADLFKIYKYPNTLVMTEITGQELVNYMEWSAKYYNTYKDGDVTISFNPNIRAYMYDMFAGVDYKVDISKAPGQRIVDLKFKGQAVKPEDKFKLVINNYRYDGLKNEKIISGEPIFESDPVSSRELIAKHIEKLGTIEPKLDNNWEIIGIDLNHPLRAYIIKEVNEGRIVLPTSEDGRTPNVKSLNVYELIKEGKIPPAVLEEYGLDSEGNVKKALAS